MIKNDPLSNKKPKSLNKNNTCSLLSQDYITYFKGFTLAADRLLRTFGLKLVEFSCKCHALLLSHKVT